MKIYFSQAKLDEYTDITEVFCSESSGPYYWNYVEYGTNPGGLDEVAIHDTVGRFIPISIDSLDELIYALNRVKEISNDINRGEKLRDYVETDVSESADGDLEW